MKTLLSAWTDASGKSYPEYLNFSLDGDEVVVTMREAPFTGASGHLANGNTASIRMPIGSFWVMWRESMRSIAKDAVQMGVPQ